MKRMGDDLEVGDIVEDRGQRYRVAHVCEPVTEVEEISKEHFPRSYYWASAAAIVTVLIYFLILGEPS